MHTVNLYGIKIFHAPLNYRSREILNQFAARKCSAKMRGGMGSLPLMCIFSADHPAEKQSHSNVTGAVYLYSPYHGNCLNAFLWRLIDLNDSCIATIC